MIIRSFMRWCAASVGTALAASLLLAAPVAHADPGPITRDSGSLTLYKHEQTLDRNNVNKTQGNVINEIPKSEIHDGVLPGGTKYSENRQPAGKPLEGIEFTLRKVNLPVTDQTLGAVNEAIGQRQWTWDAAKNSVVFTGDKTYTTTDVGKKVTDKNGMVKWDNLPLGVYVALEGNDTKKPSNNIIGKADPFLVSIPYTTDNLGDGLPDDQLGQWIYDVVAYPKNSTGSIMKNFIDFTDQSEAAPDVEPGDSRLGDTFGKMIGFTLTVPIPYTTEGMSFTDFVISDELDARFSLHTDGDNAPTVFVMEPDSVGDHGQWLGQAPDFEFIHNGDKPDYTLTTVKSDTESTVLTVSFTPEGLKKLWDYQGLDIMVMYFADAVGVGDIPNTATVTINGHEIESNQVVSPWGQLTVHKTDTSKNGTSLAGADFEVYRSTVPDATVKTPFSTTTTEKLALTAENAGATGQVTDHASLLTDAQGNASIKVLKPGIYYVKEIAAPKGFVLDSTPKVIEVKSGPSDQAKGVNWIQVVNDHQAGPALPLTGSQGQVALAASGITALLLAASTAFVARRRRTR